VPFLYLRDESTTSNLLAHSLFLSLLQSAKGQKEYHSVEEIEREWEEYTSFQRDELLSFCDFLFQEEYYERTILACLDIHFFTLKMRLFHWLL
jgi:hypothetical protein